MIEYSNRALSGLVVAVAALTWIVSRGLLGAPRRLRRWSAAILLTSAGQIPLGAITVLSGLHPLAVGSHFLLSMAALASGTFLALSAHDWVRGPRARVGPAPRPAGRRGRRRPRGSCSPPASW